MKGKARHKKHPKIKVYSHSANALRHRPGLNACGFTVRALAYPITVPLAPNCAEKTLCAGAH